MFDQIVEMVKEHMGNNPQISSAIPPGQEDAVHQEIASHISNGLNNQAASQGGFGNILSSLENGITSGSPIVNAIEGGLISSLTSKFGLPPMATGAIAASLPGLIQKFAHKANEPNSNMNAGNSNNPLSNIGGNLGGLFGK